MKFCKMCNQTKALDDFHRDKGAKDGRTSYCKVCQKAKTREWYAENREYVRAQEKHKKPETRAYMRESLLQRKYGISSSEYDELLAAQDGVCAICKLDNRDSRGRSMPVDHDHETGEVRGVLCDHCNRALGLLGDNPEVLRAAADYLERSRLKAV